MQCQEIRDRLLTEGIDIPWDVDGESLVFALGCPYQDGILSVAIVKIAPDNDGARVGLALRPPHEAPAAISRMLGTRGRRTSGPTLTVTLADGTRTEWPYTLERASMLVGGVACA